MFSCYDAGETTQHIAHAVLLVGFFQRTDILQGTPLSPEQDEDLHYFGMDQTVSVITEAAGLFISSLGVGRWLQAGDLIGQVFDGFDGQLRAEIKAPVSGLLSGIRRQPLLFEGALIARLQRAKTAPRLIHWRATDRALDHREIGSGWAAHRWHTLATPADGRLRPRCSGRRRPPPRRRAPHGRSLAACHCAAAAAPAHLRSRAPPAAPGPGIASA